MNRTRRIDRLRSACPVTITATGTWVTPARAPEACSTPVEVPPPNYTPPVDVAEPDAQYRLPNALLLSNSDFRLACSDVEGAGPYGDAVLIAAGAVTNVVVWTDLPNITSVQLDFIAQLSDSDLSVISDPSTSLDTLQNTARLTAVQAGFLTGRLAAARQLIEEETQSSALSQLRCVWRNVQQTAACPDPAAAKTDQSAEATAEGIVNPGICPAGTFESSLSLNEANALALADARRRLVCRVGNDALTRTCRDIGYAEDVPTDPPEVTFEGRRRLGAVSVRADQFFANTKAQANDLARQFAEGQLACFYVNEALSVSCGDTSPDLAQAWSMPADYDQRTPGNPVSVQAGRFIAEGGGASQSVANAQAINAATAMLACTFRNTEQVVRCSSQTIDGKVYPPKDALAQVIVPAGEVEAGSQADADELARQLGLLQLGCQYCNPYIPPSCYPADYVVQPGAAIPASVVTADWSSDVVLGLVAGSVCNEDPLQTSAVATAIALQRPIIKDQGCLYENDEMWFGCLLELPASTTLPRGGYFHPSYASNADLPAGYETVPFIDQISPFASPPPRASDGAPSYFVIQAGSYPVNSRDVPTGVSPKVYANQMARLYGLSLLRCPFANPKMDLNCETAYAPPRFVQKDVAKDNQQVTTISIPAGRHESFSSFREAVTMAQLEAQSLTDCYYENPELKVRCWPAFGGSALPDLDAAESTNNLKVYGTGKARRTWTVDGTPYFEDVTLNNWQIGSLAAPVTVPRGSFRSLISPADALQQALAYGVALLDCTAQAQSSNVCNDPMLLFCGGLVESNPAAPYQSGSNQTPGGEPWKANENGILMAGNGHNYVKNRFGRLEDLGCSSDPVGGCGGTGLRVPPCLVTASTREEANRLAYQLMRGQLDCSGSAIPADVVTNGLDGADGANGSDAPQSGCEGSCLAIYS